jgi:hypothetical protein
MIARSLASVGHRRHRHMVASRRKAVGQVAHVLLQPPDVWRVEVGQLQDAHRITAC